MTTSDGSRRLAAPGLWLLVCCLALALGPSAAAAQDAAGSGEAAAAGEATAEPDAASVEEARNRFRAGLALARNGDCAGALAEFVESYRLLPRPNTLFNMAQCEERLHRYDLAVEQYERYLATAPADAEDRDTVASTLESLRGLLGTIHVDVNTPAEVWLGDRVVGVAPGDVLVPGGHHAIELRAAGYLPERREVEVAARTRAELHVTLTTAETTIETTVVEQTVVEETHVHEHVTVERPPLPDGVFFGGVALTAAAGIVGLAAGLNALVTHDQQAARDPRLPRDTAAIRDSAMVADIGFISGGVLLVGTIAIGFLTDFGGPVTARPTEGGDDDDTSDGASEGPRATVAPWSDGTGGGLFVGGTF